MKPRRDKDAAQASERAVLRRLGIRPRKSWGQHFLVDRSVAQRMLHAWSLPPRSRVLEIGGGAGALTLPLLSAGHRVTVVEKDERLSALLRERAQSLEPNAELVVVTADVLDLDPTLPPLASRDQNKWILVGNLPYVITTAILEWTIRQRAYVSWASFMVQREYAARILAQPGTGAYGSLTVWIGYHFETRRELEVGPASFWPAPKVSSSVVRLVPRAAPPVAVPGSALLERVVRAAFSQRRKMLLGALSGGLDRPRPEVAGLLAAAGVDSRKRAEQCTLVEFAAITRELYASDQLPKSR